MTIQPGDPNGIADHNKLAARVAQVAQLQGVTVVLPPVRALGDPGHVDDHNLLTAAIEKVALEGGMTWAVVSGGTVTEYTHPTYGLMSVHTFTGNGSLVCSTPGLAEVLVVGGGKSNGDGAGNAGDVRDGLRQLSAGTLPVTVGAAGSGGFSAVGPITTGNVAWNSGPGSSPSVGAGWTTGNANDPTPSSITGTARTYAAGNLATSTATYGDGGGTPQPGVVIVAVKKP